MRSLADLYYNRHRDYDSSTGRYIQADPIGLEGGNNLYLYAEANPLRFMDPLGLRTATAGEVAEVTAKHLGEELLRPKNLLKKAPWVTVGTVCGTVIGATAWYLNQDDDGDPDCRKATTWELRKEGIDPHKVKKAMGYTPVGHFDLCKCRDGTFRIAYVNQCGRGPMLDIIR